ncbi:MAG TPA: hypothetical protein VIV40_28995 [Kofleriaceae bacterium]
MRVFLIALCACGAGGTTASAPTSTPKVRPKPRAEPRPPVDVIGTLAQPLAESSWISPGPAQLVLGGPSVQAIDGAPRLEVSVLEEQGNDVRVGVRLDHARFALWMAKSRMLAIVAREQRIDMPGVYSIGTEAMQVVLHAGAQVQRLGKQDRTTRVRYVGALEAEGWLPDDALIDRAPAGRTQIGRVPTGRKTLMLMPGAVIRVEPKWASAQLAVLNQGYFVDEIKAIDDAWSEVSYEDGDLFVHGYVSKHDPPGRTHRRKPPEQTTPLTPNATVADGTCLFVDGEEVGFTVGAQPLVLDKTNRVGWFKVTIDSPWGPIAFDVKGAIETELAKCGG